MSVIIERMAQLERVALFRPRRLFNEPDGVVRLLSDSLGTLVERDVVDALRASLQEGLPDRQLTAYLNGETAGERPHVLS